MELYNLVEPESVYDTESEGCENRPLNILLLLGVALMLWGFTIGIYQLLIAGLSSIQFSFLDYISLM